ncbi:xanthine dehydrogenase family protein molybdopterin-binding subunit [Amycolatopsis methanolica]|uniref:Aldehyde oxidase and xanthine dehydrogenase molybdopterin binding protein n=1 Tax=Amycolatopsis methanolica 239 TaxID=1068978 RepID=A0A076MTU3_AMYME|nr:xanthine dehydrogenase family protein molybdopterin-binding subunit [Amycolatopsis methanolica]AIJ21202.1 aldehyde oxidase and xanthine dehydrogenase molybdopterin binding protein [Amycolatopsis methanolica 239]
MTGVIGQNHRRADGEAKVRGTAIYGMDYTERAALHAKVLRAEVPAARVVRLDTSKAQAMPGVWAVATAADAPGLSGMMALKDQRVFADGVIRYIGEPIAAVAAETPRQARAALAAIELELEPLEPVFDLDEALRPETRLVHPDWESYQTMVPAPREGNLAWQASTERGDVDAVFATAAIVVEDEFRSPRQHQCSIEPHAAVARYEQGRYIVHTPTQFPFLVRGRVAELLGVRPSEIRIVVPTIGGGFGGKLDSMLEPLACVLARKAGRPVRIVNTRAEEMATAAPRENAVVRLRTAVSEDGEILAQEAEVLSDNGANSSGETVACANIPPLVLGGTYRIPNARYVSKVIYTNTPPTAAFRGVNGPYCVFAQEMHLDHIARELGMDRREIRRRNVLKAGEAMVNGQVLDDAVLTDALDTVERMSGEATPSGNPKALRGTAVVPLTWITNPGPSGANVKLDEDGSIVVTAAAAEIGTGAVATGIRQLVAAEFGVPFERVVVTPPDTDAAGYDHGAQGSRTTVGMGNAALDASAKVRDQILDVAAGLLEADVADLELADGAVGISGVPDRKVTLAEVAGAALFTTGPIAAAGSFAAPPIPFDAGCMVGALFTNFFAATYHAHFAEVEVDPDTGKVTVLRYAVAQDVGKAINPQMIEGQIHGGVVQGLGFALYENLRLDGGLVLDQGLESYRLPTALDAPPIDIQLLENPYPHGPLGAKGVAEPPLVPVAAVIGCAVADAIGVPVRSLPLSPFDVLAALRDKRRDEV